MELDLKLGGFVVGLMAVTAVVFFGILSLNLGGEWSVHIKALYLISYVLLVFIIINFIKGPDKERKQNEVE